MCYKLCMSTQVKQRAGRHSGSLADTRAALDAWAADMESAAITAAEIDRLAEEEEAHYERLGSDPDYRAEVRAAEGLPA